MNLVKEIEQKFAKKEALPEFQVGDTVDVHVRIKEGDKERVQVFSGTVIKIQGGRGIRGTFTVRRIVAGEGVERTFPFHTPSLQDVRVKRPGKVRRARLYYLRQRVGKATKVKERRVDIPKKGEKAAAKRGAKKKKKAPEQQPEAEPVAE
ncbi:MAG: 50S ribosomal protein L19 [Planctomycetes bacterium]|nr:50S ribosomal protein L19 [Planctomycetota bacterium]